MDLRHDSSDQRLLLVLRWLAPTIIGFAIVYAILGGLFGDWRMIASAGAIGAHGLLTILAQFQFRGGHRYRAAYLVGGGSMVAIQILTALQPALYPSFAIVPLLIAAVFLHYAPSKHTRYYLASCSVATILVVMLGELMPAATNMPAVILEMLRLSSLVAIVSFTMILLGQFSLRLQEMLAQLSAAYTTLESQHAELARLSYQHQLILNSAGEGIYGVDAQGTITFANPAAANMFGWDVADLIGQTLHSQADRRPAIGFERPIEASPIAQVLREGAVQHRTDEQYWRKDGTSFPVEYVSAPIREHEAITGAVILFRDITERVQAQATLEAERALLARRVEERTADLSTANAELARTARLKDEFLASMSHELRTPLNAILGLSEALHEGVYEALSQLQLRPIGMIEQSGRHLLALINDILDLAKVGAGKMELECEPIEVLIACQASIQFIKQQALKKRIKITTRIDPTVTTLYADERRLKQILVNLLSNAVKFTGEGGAVELHVAGDAEHQVVRFTIADTGIGIAQADLDRLFQPFMQLDTRLTRQYEGTGLGLALVARMVELHGGSIAVISTVGQGSRFTIALPWVEGLFSAPRHTPLPAQQPTAPIPFIRRALIVDDSPTATNQLVRYFAQLGVKCTTLTQGRAAMARVIEAQPDVILLDLQLPDYSGWDVLAQLKADARTQSIPVMIISVEDYQPQAFSLGASAYLVKPVAREPFQRALSSLLPTRIDTVVQTPFCLTPVPGASEQPVVLLAEDNEINIVTLTDYLHVKGYHVVVARNGFEALDRARDMHPNIILMDLQMPEMDGLEATRRLRTDPELADIPVIALTAFAMPGDRERCLAAGANEYMSKPVSLKGLAANLETLLAAQPVEAL